MAYWGVDAQIHLFLTSTVTAGEWSASRPGRFTHEERAPRYALDRRLGVPQGRSGRCGNENIFTLPGF
jgi:hypothetical protein